MKSWITKHIPLFFIIISVCSITQWIRLPLNYEIIWSSIYFLLLLGLWYNTGPKNSKLINIWIFFITIEFFYGAIIMSENYFDYKALVYNSMYLFLPISAYTFSRHIELIPNIFSKWIKYVWIIYILLFPFMYSDAHGRYLFPFCFLILFYKLLNKRILISSILALILIIIFGKENRSDIIRFIFAFLLAFAYLNFLPIRHISKIIVTCMYITPILLLFAGLFFNFNIFQFAQQYSIKKNLVMNTDNDGYTRTALEDTRTLLYIDVINSSQKHNSYIFGRSPARGYESEMFGGWVDQVTGLKRGERGGCEVAMLNIYMYLGIVGVCLYSLIFTSASFYAIWHSQNKYIPMLGIYIAFRWDYSWVEEFTSFNLSTIVLWIIIGMCFSKSLRQMSNKEFESWFKSFINGKKTFYRI